MKLTHSLRNAVFLLATASLSGPLVPALHAQAPDNSATNKTANQGPTADNQDNARSDRMTTAQVRRALIKDKGLSTYAHNIKIIVQNGNVTLKGPVRSDEEKQKVLADAGSVVDSAKISDQLTVKQ